MAKSTVFSLVMLITLNGHCQNVQFQTKFSNPFAVYEFMNSLSHKSPGNVYKRIFNHSAFNSPEYIALIATFDSLNMGYSYDFTDYPPGQKIGIDVPNLLRRNLILSDSMQDFKIRSMGLLPNEKLLKLIHLIDDFKPVYEVLIYNPSKAKFQEQLQGITALIKSSNINYYFTEALQFYHSAWDFSIPFVFAFYPLPNSRGFTATAVSNVAISAVADSLNDYKALLSVMLHEVSHVLYDERSLALWDQMEEWFNSSSSKGSRYANSLFNEAMATAVGNGYLAAQLYGKEDTTRRWYGVKYINLMAKAAYPLVKKYIEARRPMDKEFVAEYIALFDERFSAWLSDPEFLMRGRLLASDSAADVDLINSLYRPAPGNEDYTEISEETLKKMAANLGTKLIIVNSNNQQKLDLIKRYFKELTSSHLDGGTDFVRSDFLADKTWLIIVNNVKGRTVDKLNNLVIKENHPSQ